MPFDLKTKSAISTPALLFDEEKLRSNLSAISELCESLGINLLFPLKTLTQETILKIIAEYTRGFAVSSSNEARFARELSAKEQSIHFTSPGLLGENLKELADICDCFACNSITQFTEVIRTLRQPTGIRINPQLSFVKDERYDPCGRHSRLGVPIDQLRTIIEEQPELSKQISGLHIHTNSESESFKPLFLTVQAVIDALGGILPNLKWFNLGGGYLFEGAQENTYLRKTVEHIRKHTNAQIFMEPGTGAVASSGLLVTKVIDIVSNRGKNIAVLDTSVNHLPEVFEYGYLPDLTEEDEDGQFSYILAGSSCLAGDVFGEYWFTKELRLGDRLTFTDTAAYSLVKSHMFNGINLPNLYLIGSRLDSPKLLRQYGYNDFLRKYGDCVCT